MVVSKMETTNENKLAIAKNATTTTDKPNEDTEKDTNNNDTLKQILRHVASIDEKLNG